MSTMEPMSVPAPRTSSTGAAAPGRTWPLTAALVLLAVALVVVDLFGAAITTAPFFGDTPSREQYLEAGVVACSAAVPLAVLVLSGWLVGARWGLLGIVVPALVSVAIGASLLGTSGDPTDRDPRRGLRPGDLVTDLNTLNAIGLAVALVVLVAAVVSRRRRAGAAGPGSSTSSAW